MLPSHARTRALPPTEQSTETGDKSTVGGPTGEYELWANCCVNGGRFLGSETQRIVLTTKTIILAGCYSNALYGNYREPTNMLMLVVEDTSYE